MVKALHSIAFLLVALFTFSFITDDPGKKAFEDFAGNVYASVKQNDFDKFYSYCLTKEELREFLVKSEVDKKIIHQKLCEYDTFSTKQIFVDEFKKLQDCPKSEGAIWQETELVNYVTKIRADGRKGEVRIVTAARNKQFVLMCVNCHLTTNGWKLSNTPFFVSVKETEMQNTKFIMENESQR
ncbi:MAG TPA: hypothetical protein VK177_07380 [Flavobacteriales bacterium]|nr:hypothetical protein [Flavobacteriales bacterium]